MNCLCGHARELHIDERDEWTICCGEGVFAPLCGCLGYQPPLEG